MTDIEILDQIKEQMDMNFKITMSLINLAEKNLETKQHEDMFLNADEVAEILGLTTKSAEKVMQEVNKIIKPARRAKGKVLKSSLYQVYGGTNCDWINKT